MALLGVYILITKNILNQIVTGAADYSLYMAVLTRGMNCMVSDAD